ncbi:unnamed protein product [Caretta caretta]
MGTTRNGEIWAVAGAVVESGTVRLTGAKKLDLASMGSGIERVTGAVPEICAVPESGAVIGNLERCGAAMESDARNDDRLSGATRSQTMT